MKKYIVLILTMTMVSSVASLFLKKASNSFESILSIITNKNLYIGGILYCLAALVNIVVLKYMDYSVVMPLGALTYIWTMILSYFILKEKISFSKKLGVVFIICGAIVIAI